MKVIHCKKNYLRIFLLLVVISNIFLSCSNSVPVLEEVYFKHFDMTATSRERMVVFVEIESDVENLKTIIVRHSFSNKEWVIENPEIIYDKKSGNYYCGSSNLVPEKEAVFPYGEYTVLYVDRSGQETETYYFYTENQAKE